MSGHRGPVLDEDRELAQLVGESRLEAARAASTATIVTLTPGSWSPMSEAPQAQGGYGLALLEGLMVRRVGFDGRFGAELLGPRDLLRPWEADGEAGTGSLPFEASWRVMTPSRVAVLDMHWAGRMAPYPQVATELCGRAFNRSRRLAAQMAIVQVPRLDERLWMIFWELADRWGRVRPDGVYLELPLTHELLSYVAAARRPSVSGALTRLAESGRVRRAGRAWLLTGEPPEPGAASRAQDRETAPA
jgi:CRP/FNR family cyclic AMP-dependent transcriptional regulator